MRSELVTAKPLRSQFVGRVQQVPPERFRLAAAVYGILLDGDQVLLMRRAGSGYHDGELSLPAGHLDGGEDALSALLRELNEELVITVDRDTCEMVVLMHRPPESPGDHEYLDLFFTVDRWAGTPSIGEPDKCSELVWADRSSLPGDLVEYVRVALRAAATDELLVLHDWAGHVICDSRSAEPEVGTIAGGTVAG